MADEFYSEQHLPVSPSSPTAATASTAVATPASTAGLLPSKLLEVDLHSATSSLWGFVSAAATNIKEKTSHMVVEMQRDLSDIEETLGLVESKEQSKVDNNNNNNTPLQSTTTNNSSSSSHPPTKHLPASNDKLSSTPTGHPENSTEDSQSSSGWLSTSVFSSITSTLGLTQESDTPTVPTRSNNSGTTSTGNTSSLFTQSPFESKLHHMQADRQSYLQTVQPASLTSSLAEEYKTFVQSFKEEYDIYWQKEIKQELLNCSLVSTFYRQLVPTQISHEQFFLNYFWRKKVLMEEENKRQRLVMRLDKPSHQKANELSWDDDDEQQDREKDHETASKSPEKTTNANNVAPSIEAKARTENEINPSVPKAAPIHHEEVSKAETNQSATATTSHQVEETTIQPNPSLTLTPPVPTEEVKTTSSSVTSAQQLSSALPPHSSTTASATSSSTSTSASTTTTPSSHVETPAEMRERIQRETRERLMKKLAEKKAKLPTSNTSTTLVATPATTSHTNTSTLSTVTVESNIVSPSPSIVSTHTTPVTISSASTSSSSSSDSSVTLLASEQQTCTLSADFTQTISNISNLNDQPQSQSSQESISTSSSNSDLSSWDVVDTPNTVTRTVISSGNNTTHTTPAMNSSSHLTEIPKRAAKEDDWGDWD